MKKILLLLFVASSCAIASEISNPVNFSNCDTNVALYGATGNGSTDDTAAINRAIAATPTGGKLCFPTGTFKLSAPLVLPAAIGLQGTYHLGQNGGTILNQTISTSTFQLFNSGTSGAEIQSIKMSGFEITGGTYGIYAGNGGVWVTLNDMSFVGNTYGIFWRGFVQQWYLRDIDFSNDNYGLYLSSPGVATDGVTAGTPMLWDKNNFYSCYFSGNLINGIYVVMNSGNADTNTFVDPYINFSHQDGAIFGGGMSNLVIIDANNESNGFTGTTPTPATTATGTSPNNTVVVASTAGIVVGTTVTIAGAGTIGEDYVDYVTNVSSLTLTLHSNLSTSVTNAELVNYIYSDYKFIIANSAGQANIVFINPLIIGLGSQAASRYSIDASPSNNVSVISGQVGRPIYDPFSLVTNLMQTPYTNIRRPNNFSAESFQNSLFGGLNSPRTQISSPPGKNITLGLEDSTLNGAGSVGGVEIRRYDGNRTRSFFFDSSSGNETMDLGNLSFGTSGKGITGTATSDSAAAGNVGEYVQVAVTGTIPATTLWGDATSFALTAGDWDVTYVLNGATNLVAGVSNWSGFVGLVPGNSSSGIGGINQMSYVTTTSALGSEVTMAIQVRISLASTSTVYAKFEAQYSGTAPTYVGGMSARRVR